MSKRKPKALCLTDPNWRYTKTEDMPPDYLARKFAAIIKAQKKPVAAGNVTPLKKKSPQG